MGSSGFRIDSWTGRGLVFGPLGAGVTLLGSTGMALTSGGSRLALLAGLSTVVATVVIRIVVVSATVEVDRIVLRTFTGTKVIVATDVLGVDCVFRWRYFIIRPAGGLVRIRTLRAETVLWMCAVGGVRRDNSDAKRLVRILAEFCQNNDLLFNLDVDSLSR